MIGFWNGRACRCRCFERAEIILHFYSDIPDHPTCLRCLENEDPPRWESVHWFEPLDDEHFERWLTVGKVMGS